MNLRNLVLLLAWTNGDCRQIVAASLLAASRAAGVDYREQARGYKSTVDRPYPPDWWKAVRRNQAASWEILPQDARPGEVILSKRNELGLLSNFAATPIEFRGKRYGSIEGLWQSMKYPEGSDDPRANFPGATWKFTRDEVAAKSGFEAKHAGDLANTNMKLMNIDWVTFEGKQIPYRPPEPGEHYKIIFEATRDKVLQNPEVKRVLLATGDLVLKPDHRQSPGAAAAWHYNEILMAIRAELQKQQK